MVDTPKPSKARRAAPAAPAAPPQPTGALVDGDVIRMLTGQEGPGLSRVRGQELVVGSDLGAEEADRLIDVDFAERV